MLLCVGRRGSSHILGAVPRSLLEVVGIAKRFGAAVAVEEVSLEVAAGEVVGLLGPNGAGKSTTLRVIAGLVRPERGRVRIAGQDLATARLAALRAAGFLIEGPALPPELTCRQALRYLQLYQRNVAARAASARCWPRSAWRAPPTSACGICRRG